MTWIALALTLLSPAFAQDSTEAAAPAVETTAWITEDTGSKRFMDDTSNTGSDLKQNDQVSIIVVDGDQTRIRKGMSVYAWVPSSVLTTERPEILGDALTLPNFSLGQPNPMGGLQIPQLPNLPGAGAN